MSSRTSEMYQKVHLPHSCHAREKMKYMVWSNEMDNCLSKILVEETRKGNKVDGTFKSAAYITAVKKINQKFGLGLTKTHVKNRLKTWKKQFKILKELLSHQGFEWDATEKMVLADNSAWNEYMKGHPDARHFRSRVIENYDDLCVIIGNDLQIKGYSENDAIEVDQIDDLDVMGSNNALEFRNDKQGKHLRWTEEMDFYLGKLLVGEVRKGNKIDNLLHSEAYETVLSALNEHFGPGFTKTHIQNRLITWKKYYGILKKLLSHTGFKWDGTQRMIVADDSVWNDYLKTQPDAKIFHAKVIENYDHLCLILGNDNEAFEIGNSSPIEAGTLNDKVKNMMWTNEMDICLSKILAEQVRIGNKNKFYNKLNPAAYAAAVSAMKERFQMDLTKNHIKNRLKTWKKQYDMIKGLLDQNEFEWDSMRKMVVANDSAWSQIIMRNPDAKQLQGRVINYYDELSIIVGSDDLPSSLNGDDIDFNLAAGVSVASVEDAFYNWSDNAKEKGKYISWTDEMDKCLTKLLLEQALLGNKLYKNFKATAYRAALSVLNKKFSLDLTKENIINRLKTWKKQYGLVKQLLSYSGFEWDEKQKMVVASDSKWNEYIKRNPDARHLRAKSIENFNELRIILGNEQASGNGSDTGAEVAVGCAQNNEDHAETPLNLAVDKEMSHDAAAVDTREASEEMRSKPSSSDSGQPLKRRRVDDVLLELLSSLATNLGKIAEALSENKNSSNNVCLEEVFEMVKKIPDFDDDLVIDACEYLSSEDNRARMFLKLDDRLRKKWLLKRLRGG